MDLNDNQLWYVRAAIRRGMDSVQQQIDDATDTIEKLSPDSEMRATIVNMMENMRAYNEQMLREMKQYIPEELQ